jgi:RNA polymerase sigma factor (sigma-70 family)
MPIVYPEPNEYRQDVAAALESLPAHYREIILLRDLEGLTVEEMSTQLGLTREAVKSRLHRARVMAREYLSS